MTTERTPTTPTPKTTTPTKSPRKLGELVASRNPENDLILEAIKDQEVTVSAATSEQRQGKRRKYWLTTVTLADGRTFTVSGKAVAEPLGYLEPSDYPIDATFYLEPSDFGEGEWYWAVK